MKTGMSRHTSTRMQNDEWLTPPSILKELGHFDLDPCSPINRPWESICIGKRAAKNRQKTKEENVN